MSSLRQLSFLLVCMLEFVNLAAQTVQTYGRLDLFDVFIGCEWLQVNKVRAQAQDPATFDEMYELIFIYVRGVCIFLQRKTKLDAL